jgi:AcrR family transcriptional regulator
MPKGFSDQEKKLIHAKLLEQGRECFGRYGIRKTNVEDLTQAAGISKGAFYLFYASKEELFFEVLEQAEAEQRARILSFALQPRRSTRQNFKAMLKDAFEWWENNAFFKTFKKEDYELLLRKLPSEKVAHHLQSDEGFVETILQRWNKEGVRFAGDVKTIAGLMKALFFVSLHKDDLGPEAYPQTMDTLIDLVTKYIIKET